MRTNRTARRVALLAGGFVTGAALAGALGASATTSTPAPSSSTASSSTAGSSTAQSAGSESGNRPQETPLTGDSLSKVTAAINAKYPGATIDRAETDADGGGTYEAHITKKDGSRVTVLFNSSFSVTGEEAGGRGGPGGDMGPGAHRGGNGGQSGPAANGETALTGSTLSSVKSAVLNQYPGATVDLATTEKDGNIASAVSEAHITKSDGTRVEVLLDKDFAIVGEEAGHGSHGGQGGPDGDGGFGPGSPGGQASAQEQQGSNSLTPSGSTSGSTAQQS
ncbi:MAG: hypothetical protein ACTHMW_03020 [Actinomycetes bacterium]